MAVAFALVLGGCNEGAAATSPSTPPVGPGSPEPPGGSADVSGHELSYGSTGAICVSRSDVPELAPA